jgi:hypothetical protein
MSKSSNIYNHTVVYISNNRVSSGKTEDVDGKQTNMHLFDIPCCCGGLV